jgi:hypothetical protein
MDRETWLFINTFADWLAALGTLAAVITSLYLARKSDRITLELRVGIRNVGFITARPITTADPQVPPKLFWICVTNIGRRRARITILYWKPVPWRKRGVVFVPPRNQYSSAFPIVLTDREEAIYAWPLSEFDTKGLCDEFTGLSGAFRLHLHRLCVTISTGEVFTCKPEKELRKFLRDSTVNAIDKAKPKPES